MMPMKTVRDVIDDLLDFLNERGVGNALRACKRATVEALRELVGVRDWACYRIWAGQSRQRATRPAR